MKMLMAAAFAATTLIAGLAAGAAPASAAPMRCGCPAVYHHPIHRAAVRRRVVYRHIRYAPRPAEVVYREAPPRPEPVYDYGYGPAYYGGPVWVGGEGYHGGRYWHGGWGHRGWVGHHHRR